MKKRLTNIKSVLLILMFLITLAVKSNAQTNTYNAYIKNVVFLDCKNLEFEIWIEWTGTNTNKFQFYQAGINFNYAGLANGGTMTGAFVPGSADASLAANQQAPNWNINATSKQIRMLAAIATPVGSAATAPGPPGFRLGKFKITNTADFPAGATPNFVWSFSTGSSTTTQTKVAFYLGSATTGNDITVPAQHFVSENPAFNLNCGAPCNVTAAIDQNTPPVCLNGTNGSVRVTLSGSGTAATGTYTLDGVSGIAFSTNPFTVSGLSAGLHTITAITATPCTSNTAQFTVLDGANPDDGNACTNDACNSSTGVSHTPISTDDGDACTTDGCNTATGAITHLPVNTDDGNACTTDGCNSITGISHDPVNVDDGDQCTNDVCNTSTGAVTHPPVNVDDNNVCTVDGCNSPTGVFHTPVNTDDSNPCTTDGCNSISGIFHNPVSVDDGNGCTTDACNTTSGTITHDPVNVDDSNPCTVDACNTSTGTITHVPVNTDDGNACTTDDCNSISGIFHTPVNVDDGNPCTNDACNTSTGTITHLPVAVDDGNACTTDACNTTTGNITHVSVNTDDGNPCTTDGCNTSSGVFHTPVSVTDGNACTNDACNTTTGTITHDPVNVDDGNACTVDACNSTTGTITHVGQSADDGNPCTVDACNSITGVTHTPVVTDDGNACTTDGCSTVTGVFHTPVSTDDGNVCTTDGCNSVSGVFHTPVSTNDNNACTIDGCVSTTGIFHTPVVTDDGNLCTVDGCNTTTGVTHTPVNINDNDACTTDGCNSLTGIFHTPIPGCGVCQNPPTVNAHGPYTGCGDVLLNGTVGGSATGGTWSSPTGGTFLPNNTTLNAVYHPSAADLNNGSVVLTLTSNNPLGAPCTAEISTATITFGAISDNNGCTIDACNTTTGTVTHTPVDINDNDNCTADACNSTTGVITHISKIIVNTSSTPAGCNASDGSAGASGSGGTDPYSYSWSPGGETTSTITGLAAGTYVVTVTDNNGCSATKSVVVASGSAAFPPGPISGPAGACRGQRGVVYCVDPVPGATSYIWTLPSGASGSSNGPCITVRFGSHYSGGNICVKFVSQCGTSPKTCLNVPRIKNKPAKPGPISGPLTLCPNTDGTYSINPVANATSYIWSTTGGLVITSGQGTTSIGVHSPAGFVTGTISVRASNCKGNSDKRTITVKGVPAVPQWDYDKPTDNQTTNVCGGSTHKYELHFKSGVTCYLWSAPPGAVIHDQSGNSGNPLLIPTGNNDDVTITFPQGFVEGDVTVSACNQCGSSGLAVLHVTAGPGVPVWFNADPQDNPTTGVCGGSTEEYEIKLVPGATCYTWTAPPGAIINDRAGHTGNPLTVGPNVNDVDITFPPGFDMGDVTVSACNSCGTSAVATITVHSVPEQPQWDYDNPSDNATFVCGGNTRKYEVHFDADVTCYNWTAPPGAVIHGPNGTSGNPLHVSSNHDDVTITYPQGFVSGQVTVSACNACGSSQIATLNVSCTTSMREAVDRVVVSDRISSLTAFPNPTSGIATISFYSETVAKYTVRVIDIVGRTIYLDAVPAIEGYNMREINLESVNKGLYFVSVQTEGKEAQTIRIVVE